MERRLIRRAEALWEELGSGQGMPPATALARFSGPGFADHSLLFAPPDWASDGTAGEKPRLLRTGQALAALLGGEGERRHPSASLLERLVGLATEAAARERPARLELGPGQWPGTDGSAELLLRAIALPFAMPQEGPAEDRGSRAAVLVVVSWRQLLSAEQTDALHKELAVALERLHQSGG